MKNLYVYLFILVWVVPPNYSLGQSINELLMAGHSEYQEGNYCIALEKIESLEEADSNELKLAKEVFGLEKYKNVYKISSLICQLESKNGLNSKILKTIVGRKSNRSELNMEIEEFILKQDNNEEEKELYNEVILLIGNQDEIKTSKNAVKNSIGFNFEDYILWLVPAVFICLLGGLYIIQNMKLKRLSKQLQNANDELSHSISKYSEDLIEKDAVISSIKRQLRVKTEDFDTLTRSFKSFKEEAAKVPEEEDFELDRSDNTLSVDLPVARPNLKYLSMSLPNGRFVKCLNSMQEGRTYFKLTVMSDNENKGTFNVITGNPIITRSLLQNVRDYLKPVCTIENEGMDNPREIEIVKDGLAEKVNNFWEMKAKAIIRLIY